MHHSASIGCFEGRFETAASFIVIAVVEQGSMTPTSGTSSTLRPAWRENRSALPRVSLHVADSPASYQTASTQAASRLPSESQSEWNEADKADVITGEIFHCGTVVVHRPVLKRGRDSQDCRETAFNIVISGRP
jgi:hypothetical protein